MRKMPLPIAVALMPEPRAAHDFRIDAPACHVAPDGRPGGRVIGFTRGIA